jgi:predicted esterase
MKAISCFKSVFGRALIVLLVGIAVASCLAPSKRRGGDDGLYQKNVEYKLVVGGFEWGPAITKTILIFPELVSAASFGADIFTVMAGDTPRTVTSVYLSDEAGNGVFGTAANFVTIELKTGYNNGAIDNSSPFRFTFPAMKNIWAPLDIYTIKTAEGKTISVDGNNYSVYVPASSYNGKVSPASDGLVKASYVHNDSQYGSIKINMAAFESAALAGDTGKNPLIIWLHGSGGGNADDIDIALYDNDVTELMSERIQRHFKTGSLEGAYVLYPQCATWWMDNGQGEMSARGPNSKYTESLKAAIDNYVAGNNDLDTSCIYIGGCSNGGYMVVNMMVHHPAYFAAAYPICEVFADSETTKTFETILKDEAIWFVVSADDTIAAPVEDFTLKTYVRLVQAGAQNVHLSYYDHVYGEDAPGVQYMGHWSWVYPLQDRTIYDQDAAAVMTNGLLALSTSSEVPVKINGQNVGLWAWMSAQKAAL